MASYTTLLYLAHLAAQLYALTYHFPSPPKSTGIFSLQSPNILKLLTTTTAALSFIPTILLPLGSGSGSHPATPDLDTTLSPILQILGPTLLLFSESLFLWAAYTTKPKTLSVIFGRVTPARVIASGPYGYVRHPTYVAYASGWMGVAAVIAGRCGLCDSWSIAVMGCVAGLCWLYAQGARLEERMFLQEVEGASGNGVDGKVKREYAEFVKQVPFRWVPGVF
ncbi:hypothetical protein BDW74DRAFT_158996 [Aspergillus multicolor]|uniref:methyltransferase family protein n=1 Tax=Aspergillus multicolor TaxID=41759 RepID=UPI003CCDE3FB